MDATRILMRDEVLRVIADLKQKKCRRSRNREVNLVLFRLSTCCGLRVKELVGVNLGDFVVSGPRPCIRIRKEVTKGRMDRRKARLVPLWWDAGTLADVAEWKKLREEEGASMTDPFLTTCSKSAGNARLTRGQAQRRWKTALRSLGPERVHQVSIHGGRGTFISHALHVGRTLVEVRDAAGHRNIATTSVYAHLVGSSEVRDLFGVKEDAANN